jgi:hypothetical protein
MPTDNLECAIYSAREILVRDNHFRHLSKTKKRLPNTRRALPTVTKSSKSSFLYTIARVSHKNVILEENPD